MKIEVFDTAEQAAHRAATHVIATVQDDPDLCLGLATGRTMVPVYDWICSTAPYVFGRCTTVMLDEYVGLGSHDPGSFARFLRDHLFDRIDPSPKTRLAPDGLAQDPCKEATRMDAKIQHLGGIGLQLLGIGGNGHIGFNEPGAAFDQRCHVTALAAQTRAANAEQFADGHVPTHAITLGIGTILEAKQCLLVATGAGKSKAVKQMLNGPISPDLPASALRTHENTVVILDRAAHGLLA